MGLFDFLKSKTTINSDDVKTETNQTNENIENITCFVVEDITPTVQNALTIPFRKISIDIIKLLWFADGEFKNYYDLDNVPRDMLGELFMGASFDDDGNLNCFDSSSFEPSVIYSDLPIKNLGSYTDKPNYFPTYTGLHPDQRYIYLDFLMHPFDTPNIDIGYVFIFYYGLERYLYLREDENAYNMIFKLLQIYNNKSFQSYATTAILYYAIWKNNVDKITNILNTFENIKYSDIGLYAKYVINDTLTSGDIIALSKRIEFKNHKYINSNYGLFKSTLDKYIFNEFGAHAIPLSALKKNTLPNIDIDILANVSLRNKFHGKIKSLLQNKKLSTIMYYMLTKTHEDVKEILKVNKKEYKIKND